MPDVQRQQLRDALAKAARAYKAGELQLELFDGRRLTRLMLQLRANALIDKQIRDAKGSATKAPAVRQLRADLGGIIGH